MNLQNNMGWLFSVFAFVTLFAGGSFVFIGDNASQSEQVPFSMLSEADVDMILAVKEEMNVARIQ
ncbi:MAG TPA: hypothetical protein ENJ87_10470 [Gammaproteobacteria bacterium]|nr:hypothetical protein [Gammaproteobacteria bacterium]